MGFRNTYVFDISQTDGVDLPSLQSVTGDPGENIEAVNRIPREQGHHRQL